MKKCVIHAKYLHEDKWSIMGRWTVTDHSVTACDVNDMHRLYKMYLVKGKPSSLNNIYYDGMNTIKLDDISMAENVWTGSNKCGVYKEFLKIRPYLGSLMQIYCLDIKDIIVENGIIKFNGNSEIYGVRSVGSGLNLTCGLNVEEEYKPNVDINLEVGGNFSNGSSMSISNCSKNINITHEQNDLGQNVKIMKGVNGSFNYQYIPGTK